MTQISKLIGIGYGDKVWPGGFPVIDPGVLAQLRSKGGRWAAYQSHAMDSSTCGHLQFLRYGSDPANPDAPPVLDWKYRLVGYVDLAEGVIVREPVGGGPADADRPVYQIRVRAYIEVEDDLDTDEVFDAPFEICHSEDDIAPILTATIKDEITEFTDEDEPENAEVWMSSVAAQVVEEYKQSTRLPLRHGDQWTLSFERVYDGVTVCVFVCKTLPTRW